jgi:hypothetical protein
MKNNYMMGAGKAFLPQGAQGDTGEFHKGSGTFTGEDETDISGW